MSLVNITGLLDCAAREKAEWSSLKAFDAANLLSGSTRNPQIDWDQGAGESWIGVLYGDGGGCVYVSAVIPFAFALAPISAELLGILDSAGIVVAVVSDWEAHDLSADPGLVVNALELSGWSDVVDPKSFSAAELVWMSI